MERLIGPVLENLSQEHGLTLVKQKAFSYLQDKYGLEIPAALGNRKFDFVLLGKRKNANMNVETNFYSGGGSKPEEIVESYIIRKNELARANWKFIWVTDGAGWRDMRHQIERAFNEMDYILNAEFIRRGLLAAILKLPS